jgi:hypothetical protein
MIDLVYDHLDFYHRFAIGYWHNLGPDGYAAILAGVALLGYALMKSGAHH